MIGLVSKEDELHEVAKKIFEKINSKNLNDIFIPSSVFIEYELLLKSNKITSKKIVEDIVNFKELGAIKEIPLNSSILILALNLRNKFNLTYFDSLHCSSALFKDKIIVGTDSDFEKIPDLTIINPKEFLKKFYLES